MNGLSLFSKYAFPPNLLQYCGPEGNMFFEIFKDNLESNSNPKEELTKEIRHLSLQFEGAVPYLKLIAGENNIKDVFDSRVIEAYWLGNNLLTKVRASSLYYHIEERFRKKATLKDWQDMKNPEGLTKAKPFHNYHVFSIFSKVGLMKSGERKAILSTMNNCRISWGKVKEIVLDKSLKNAIGSASVEYSPLKFDEFGNLKLEEKITGNFHLLDDSIKRDDKVSLHWNYVCDKITPQQKNNLEYWTSYHIEVFNGPSR